MNRLVRYFVNGLLFSTPIALTLYVCWRIFRAVDGWLGLPWHGAGFIATIVLITLVGYLATTYLWSSLFGLVEQAMERVPLVRFLYNSLKEVLGAFVGEKKRFDRPVVVQLIPGGNARALGLPDAGVPWLTGADGPGRGLPAPVLQLRRAGPALSPRPGDPDRSQQQRRDGVHRVGRGGGGRRPGERRTSHPSAVTAISAAEALSATPAPAFW